MSAVPGPAGQSSRGWLIGVGAGCGCLTLLAAVAVVLIIVAGLSRSPGAGAPQQPGPAAPQGGVSQGAAPQAGAPQPSAPQPAAPRAAQPGAQSAYQIQLYTVRIDAQRQSAQPADVFRVGETVGTVVKLLSVPRAGTLRWFILRWNPGQVGQSGTIVTDATTVDVKPEMRGQQQLLTTNTNGATAGAYAVVFVEPGAGNQVTPIASHNFQLQ